MSAPRADWIAALATPEAPAPRGVLRASGAGLIAAAPEWLPASLLPLSGAREVREGRWDWLPGADVACRLLVFPAPASATGEDVLELHLPGSLPLLENALARLQQAGMRLAEPGEFTRRAFLNGRLDLTQAEAVLDLVQSRNQHALRTAAEVLAGRPGDLLRKARESLAFALVQVETSLDFEEGDSQDLQPAEIEQLLHSTRAALVHGGAVESQRQATLRSGWRIGLIGAPNAGKSTLFTRLTGARALVSELAGTTRDRLEARWDPGPLLEHPQHDWILADQPGLSAAGEQVGAADARDAAAQARAADDRFDFCWWVVNGSDADAVLPAQAGSTPGLTVITHGDLPRRLPGAVVRRAHDLGEVVWIDPGRTSAVKALARHSLAAHQDQEALRHQRLRSVARHRQALQQAQAGVADAESGLRQGLPLDLVAEELRRAMHGLDTFFGRFTPEDLLDRLFAQFCVGK